MTESSQKTIDDFTLLAVIGKGCYGKILLVKQNKTQKVYAMKVLKKKLLALQNKINHIFTERNLLIEFDHPFIIKMTSTFQDDKKIYFALEYCPGGQLYNLLFVKQKFTQEQVKFYIAQIILALRYIHKKYIVYRDLKPENILIDKEGYVKLTDFGLSKKIKKNEINKFSLSGMPEYMAPQILNYQDCSKAVDFWCLGSLMYEMLTGYVPFFSENQNQLYDNIKYKEFLPDKEANLSDNCIDLLNKLFIKDPANRFGMKSENEIQNHPWFSGINWEGVLNKKYRAPFIPILSSENDTSYFCPEVTEQSVHSLTKYDETHSGDTFQDDEKFNGFDYYGDSEEDKSEKDPGSPKKIRSKKQREELYE